MGRKKVKKRKRKYIDGDGKEYTFDDALEITLGSGSLENLLEEALDLDEDDEVIKRRAVEIKDYIKKTSRAKNVLRRWYNLGKILQFVDDLNLRDESSRNEAFRRLFHDLMVDKGRTPSLEKVSRYPEHMYMLAKIPEKIVFYSGMTWSRWFDILEYKAIVKDKQAIYRIVRDCCINNWTAKELRSQLQKLNRKIKHEIAG